MRNIALRPGEPFTTGDTSVIAEQGDAGFPVAVVRRRPEVARPSHTPSNPYENMSDQQWLEDYERELRRQYAGKTRVGAGDI